MLNGSRPYIIKGNVEEDFGSITLTVTWMGFLDRYKPEASQSHKPNGNVI